MSHLETFKAVHLAGDPDGTGRRFVIAPYFSQPAYINLYHSLRHFCKTSDITRDGSSLSADGEKDFFPILDALYDEALSLFDVAIEQVSKETHPDAQAPALAPSASALITELLTTKKSGVLSPPTLSDIHAPSPVLKPVLPSTAVIPAAPPPVRRIQPKRAKQSRKEELGHSCDNKRAKLAPLPAKSGS